MANDIKTMEGMDDSPVGVCVGGKFFKMGMLRESDYIDCMAWKSAQAAEALLAIGRDNRPDTMALKADSIARIMDWPVEPIRMLNDAKCWDRLAFYAAIRGGDYPGQRDEGGWKYFMSHLDAQGLLDLHEALWRVSGFPYKKIVKATGPEDANATENP